MPLEIRNITAANLPDAARLCTAGASLGDRPKAFTREVEQESSRCKLSMLRSRMTAGARAFAAYREGLLVGYAELFPVEQSVAPVAGAGFHVLQCLRVPERAERVEVENDLCDAAAAAIPESAGIVAVARDKEWGSLGFTEVEREASEVDGDVRVLWYRKIKGGAEPKFVPIERKYPRPEGKVRLDLFTNERCPWDKYVFDMVRAVAAPRRSEIALFETDCTRRREVLRYGVTAGVAINGRFQPWVRPYRLPDEHTIRRTLEAAM